jgi:D-serine deaminase-like pyridoxal phosphate-dependent protein
MRVEGLDTPVPVVDIDLMEANLRRMQAYCDAHGLRLRPHIKTHKCPEIARMQLELGAVGITCQKLGEAEIFADAGFDDIHMSYPIIGASKAKRLGELAKRIRISASVDSDPNFDTIEAAAIAAGTRIPVLVDFDSGAGRTGVPTPEAALRMAQRVLRSANLEFGGLITYPLMTDSGKFYEHALALFSSEGIEIPSFSGAGTPTAWAAHETPGLTEVRQGSYVFFDRSIVADGAATLDQCAVHVHATVISRNGRRVILDAGSKTLSSDRIPETSGPGFGLIREFPDAVIARLYEEHALVNVPEDCKGLQIGDRVRILPNHVCVVVNLHDTLLAARNGEIVKHFDIAARGRST